MDGDDGHFIELLDLLAFFSLTISRELAVAEHFHDTHLPVSFDDREAAAFGFGLDLHELRGDLLALGEQHDTVAMRRHQAINVGRTGRFEGLRLLGDGGLFVGDTLFFRAQHFLGPQGFSQIRTALVAFGDSQAEERLEAKVEHFCQLSVVISDSCFGIRHLPAGFAAGTVAGAVGFLAAWQR